jgi:heptosyltransferase-1
MKLLIVRTGALGDILHALPAVAALRLAQPSWQIDWLVDPRWSPLLTNSHGDSPIVTGVPLAETRLWSRSPASPTTLRSILALRRRLRSARYDLVVDLQGTLRSAVLGRFAAAPRFAGYADPREPLAARLYRSRIPRQGTHVVDQATALLAAATGQPLTPASGTLPHEPSAEAWAATLTPNPTTDRRLAVLAPDAGWGAKRWPAARFAELAHRLHALGYTVLINSPSQTDPLALEVLASSSNTAALAPCDVAGMVALLRRASLVIGGDSGPVHLAAALAVPTVALFGPTDPARNGPWGPGPKIVLRDPASPTTYKRTDTPDPGLARISVETVLAAIRRLDLRE